MKQNQLLALLFLSLLFYSCKKSEDAPTPNSSDVTIDIDAGTTFQTMQGFGTSVRLFDDPHVFENFDPVTQRAATTMTIAQQDEVLNKLYMDLKLTRVRPIIEGNDIEVINDNADPNNTDLTKFNFTWKRNDGFIEYMKRVTPRGVNTYFLSPLTLENWMNETNPEEYVEWAMAIINRWKAQGVELPYYSIVNEPGYQRSRNWSGEYIRDVIKLLGAKLQAQGLNTKIVTPDDLNPVEAYKRAAIILADPVARQYVGALATHLYDVPPNLTNLKTLSDQYNIPLWMTEYSVEPNKGDAFKYATLMHDLIATYNVTAIDYMWGYFGQWENGKSELISLNNSGSQYLGYKFEKIYYVVGQFSKFIKQGAKRVKSLSSNSSVQVTAYINGTTTTIVMLNNSGNSQTAKFNLSGLNVTRLNAVRTSATENWSTLSPVSISGTGFTTTLPANSITTFYN